MKTNKLLMSEDSDIQAAGSQSGQNHQAFDGRLRDDDTRVASNSSNASNDANYNRAIHLLSNGERSINDDLTSTCLNDEVPERVFMNSLIKHTGIALAIIVPLAAFSAYAATPSEVPTSTVGSDKVDANTANAIIDIKPSSIIHKPATEPTTVDSLDLKKYSGKWYEIGRLPMYFQRNCASDVTATYTPNVTDPSITVLNQCADEEGEPITAEGLAKPIDDTGSKLNVTFLPSWIRWLPVGRADYWVLAHDPSYQTALVGTPDKEYLWLLARSPNISQESYANYRQIAQQQGYDLKAFKLTDHHNQTVNLVP
ncbi:MULTISPECIES: lipocalin family protein [unclassified Psychrobacter]|uniref:lipocalin family protein n=1 Tax=unclassified Psychrobacter TaxID=196806 RepID=UPI0009E90FB1|nr:MULTISPECIES: lipocalin family protein [unclassified Psychrobacter]